MCRIDRLLVTVVFYLIGASGAEKVCDRKLSRPNYNCPQQDRTLVVVFQHEKCVDRYYRCVSGVAYEFQCPFGTSFDPLQGRCRCATDIEVRFWQVKRLLPSNKCVEGVKFVELGAFVPQYLMCVREGVAELKTCPVGQSKTRSVQLLWVSDHCEGFLTNRAQRGEHDYRCAKMNRMNNGTDVDQDWRKSSNDNCKHDELKNYELSKHEGYRPSFQMNPLEIVELTKRFGEQRYKPVGEGLCPSAGQKLLKDVEEDDNVLYQTYPPWYTGSRTQGSLTSGICPGLVPAPTATSYHTSTTSQTTSSADITSTTETTTSIASSVMSSTTTKRVRIIVAPDSSMVDEGGSDEVPEDYYYEDPMVGIPYPWVDNGENSDTVVDTTTTMIPSTTSTTVAVPTTTTTVEPSTTTTTDPTITTPKIETDISETTTVPVTTPSAAPTTTTVEPTTTTIPTTTTDPITTTTALLTTTTTIPPTTTTSPDPTTSTTTVITDPITTSTIPITTTTTTLPITTTTTEEPTTTSPETTSTDLPTTTADPSTTIPQTTTTTDELTTTPDPTTTTRRTILITTTTTTDPPTTTTTSEPTTTTTTVTTTTTDPPTTTTTTPEPITTTTPDTTTTADPTTTTPIPTTTSTLPTTTTPDPTTTESEEDETTCLCMKVKKTTPVPTTTTTEDDSTRDKRDALGESENGTTELPAARDVTSTTTVQFFGNTTPASASDVSTTIVDTAVSTTDSGFRKKRLIPIETMKRIGIVLSFR